MNSIRCGCIAVALTLAAPAFAQQEQDPSASAGLPEAIDQAQNPPGAHHRLPPLVRKVRAVTAKYRNVDNATADGYQGGPCVSGPEYGAMGIHYVNEGLLGDGAVDVNRPEALVYEPGPDGRLRLVAVEYITLADVWNGVNEGPPVIAGQQFHLTGEPNRSRLPSFYELHVWAWRRNPMGTFADWNPHVSCDAFNPA